MGGGGAGSASSNFTASFIHLLSPYKVPGSRLVYTVGEGEGRMNWESSIEIYTLTCAKQIASGKLLCNKGSPVLCDNLEIWDGGGGKDAREGGDILYTDS